MLEGSRRLRRSQRDPPGTSGSPAPCFRRHMVPARDGRARRDDFRKHGGWQLIAGKTSSDWRGTAVLFRKQLGKHCKTRVTRAGVSTCIKNRSTGDILGAISFHLPHHATVDQTNELLHELGTHQACRAHKIVMGTDLNESVTESTRQGGMPFSHGHPPGASEYHHNASRSRPSSPTTSARRAAASTTFC